ncbi:MAG: glycosyltransferase [Elusimicrobia bacterium]|nr:glycosyltransferase [Elusimicrobiota bacterium]
MKKIIINKKVLALFPFNDSEYFNTLRNHLKYYFAYINFFNYLDYFNKNGIKNTENFIEKFIFDNKIDWILCFPYGTVYDLSIDFYAKLKDKVKVVIVANDDDLAFDVFSKYYNQLADAVMTTDYFTIFGYKRFDIPAIFFPPAHSKKDYYPIDLNKDIDVCFIGDCTKSDRMEYINYLLKNGIALETFGKGSKNGFINWADFSKICSMSKINITFNKLDKLNWFTKDEPLLNRVRQNKGHFSQIALTKTFCLSEYAPSLNIICRIGKEIDIFNNKEELLDKVKYYLANDKKREEIAKLGYERAINNYEIEISLPRTLKKLEDILRRSDVVTTSIRRTEIFMSTNFKVKQINSLTFSMFAMIKHGKIKYIIETFFTLFKYGFYIFIKGFGSGLIRVIKSRYNKLFGL